MEIFKSLNSSDAIEGFEFLDYKKWKDGYYFKLRITLKDNTVLFVKEYADEAERNYSFHWQDAENKLIIRWDNASHHRHIETYPHHKHIGGTVRESFEISLNEVLSYIEQHERI
ncbi:MAG TPA: hypothetical protein ENK58_04645 [Desulfobacterales bacterium]|nr:hypothetical protein [Desulfobacterales bacterium]